MALNGCRECGDRELSFDRAWSAFEYEGVARDLVHALKARGTLLAAGAMAQAIVRYAPPGLIDATLVPVPAHPARHRREGFNHASELARELKFQLGAGVAPALKRRNSQPQVGRLRTERIAGARDSVAAVAHAFHFDSVTLIDDVYTTGATLDACARALRGAGVQRITALTFARAVKY